MTVTKATKDQFQREQNADIFVVDTDYSNQAGDYKGPTVIVPTAFMVFDVGRISETMKLTFDTIDQGFAVYPA